MSTTTALAKTENGARSPATLKDWISSVDFKNAIAQSLPRHMTADRFVRVAIAATTRIPALKTCDPSTVLQCMMTLSQLGLEPDGRLAHLIPFGKVCQLIIDYKGLVNLAMRSGQISFIHADVVCENDEFDYDRGELKKHKIDFKKPRGPVYAAYCLARFKDGGEKVEVMHKDEIEAVRHRSKAGNSGPWKTDWNEMAKKSCARRLSKWLPLSPEFHDAVAADDDQLIESQVVSSTTLVENLLDTEQDETSQLQTVEPEDVSQEVPNIPDEHSDVGGVDSAQELPARGAKEKLGSDSAVWGDFVKVRKLVSNSELLEAKERLGWINTPLEKLRTAQLIQLNAELRKLIPAN